MSGLLDMQVSLLQTAVKKNEEIALRMLDYFTGNPRILGVSLLNI